MRCWRSESSRDFQKRHISADGFDSNRARGLTDQPERHLWHYVEPMRSFLKANPIPSGVPRIEAQWVLL